MKLKTKTKRAPGSCDVAKCGHPTEGVANGKTFFSNMAGEIELCSSHITRAHEMAEARGNELEWHESHGIAVIDVPPEPADDLKTELAAETTEAEGALEAFRDFTINTKDDLAFAAEMLAEAKGHFKRLDDKRKTITQPLSDALKATRALFKPALDFYSECEATLKGKMGEAHQRAQAEQRAALTRASEAAAGGDSGAVDAALAVMDAAAEFPETDGVQYRSSWKFEITDEALIPREYLTPNLKLISGAVTHRKGATSIPGIRVFEDTIIASKSA